MVRTLAIGVLGVAVILLGSLLIPVPATLSARRPRQSATPLATAQLSPQPTAASTLAASASPRPSGSRASSTPAATSRSQSPSPSATMSTSFPTLSATRAPSPTALLVVPPGEPRAPILIEPTWPLVILIAAAAVLAGWLLGAAVERRRTSLASALRDRRDRIALRQASNSGDSGSNLSVATATSLVPVQDRAGAGASGVTAPDRSRIGIAPTAGQPLATATEVVPRVPSRRSHPLLAKGELSVRQGTVHSILNRGLFVAIGNDVWYAETSPGISITAGDTVRLTTDGTRVFADSSNLAEPARGTSSTSGQSER
jgi:hypothetical protein